MNTRMRQKFTTKNMTVIAILAAVASVLFLIEVPVVGFYKLDFSNLPVLLGTFALGPLAGTLTLGIKSLIGLLHSSSQGVGELADFLVGLGMVLPAGFIYQKKRSRQGAIIGMSVGTVLATIIAVISNLLILIPFFSAVYHMPIEQIVGIGQQFIPSMNSLGEFVLYITAPFNLLKWVLISILGGLMYKPLSPLLHGEGIGGIRRQEVKGKAEQ